MCAITQKVLPRPTTPAHTYSPFWADQIYVAGWYCFFFSFPLLLLLGNNHSWHYWHLGISGALASPLAAIPANVLNPLAFEALVCAFHIPNFCSVCRFMTNVFVYPNIILLWLMCFLHPSSPPCPAPFSTGSQQFFPFFCVHRLAVVHILCAVRVYI